MNPEIIMYIKYAVAFVVIALGYFVVRFGVHRFVRAVSSKVPADLTTILNYFLFYAVYLLLVATVLQSIGINISAVIAAAGVAGVAIGFAAQTSLSNIISGVMLVLERSFKVGDLIIVDAVRGSIESIGLMAMTLKTADNKSIRIPNEQLIKGKVINLTTRGTRRLTFQVTFATTLDGAELMKELETIVTNCKYRVSDKPISISYSSVGTGMRGLSVQFWVKSKEVIAAQGAFLADCVPLVQSSKPNHLHVVMQQS